MATEEESRDIRMKEEEKEREREKKLSKYKYKVEDVAALAIDIFGEDRVDVNRNSVIIHFPKINITNSKGHNHVIRDLYIKFDISLGNLESEGRILSVSLLGRRNTLSLEEAESSYFHSHLSSSYGYSYFCMGSSPFYMLMEEVCMSPSEDNWNMLFLSLSNYLEWESLEGGPYTQISNISYQNEIYVVDAKKELMRIFSGIPTEIWSFSKYIEPVYNAQLFNYFDEHSKIRKENGLDEETKKRRIQSYERSMLNEGIIKWKGKEIPPTVYDSNGESDKATIDMGVVDMYLTILKQEGVKFSKKYQYGRTKQEQFKKVFGEGRIIKQAKAVHNKGVEE